jgi:SAM-dependent methyltransferase
VGGPTPNRPRDGLPVDAHQETANVEKYERSGLEGRLIERFRRRVLRELRPLEARSVLDAGSGEGTMTAWLAAGLPLASVTGLEARPEAVAEFARRNPHLEIVSGDLYALPFADGAFELVVAFEVLEHLDRPGAALRELARVSARHLFLTVPHEPFFRAGNLLRGRYVERLGSTPGHQSSWGRRAFRRLVATEAEALRWVNLFPWQGILAVVRPRRAEPAADSRYESGSESSGGRPSTTRST